MWRDRLTGVVVCWSAIVVLLLTAGPARAQSATGNIHGVVTDQSGAALPGVTVTLNSAALLVPQTSVSDGGGAYRFDQLPVGLFKLTYELSGFGTLVREGVQLSAGFSAQLNAQLGLATVAENVTVIGSSPVVDTSNATSSISVPASVLADKLPVTRVMQSVIAVAPGVQQTGPPDLGGGNVGTTQFRAYGMTGQSTPLIEGINTRRTATGVETNFDFTAIEEFQIITFGGDAEKALPGVALNAIIKSGGNMFSGRFETSYEDDALESNNLTPLLRSQGTTNPNLILTALDSSASLGGPVVKNKMWFFGAYHLNRSRRTALGYIMPDGTPGDSFVRAQNFSAKGTYQLSTGYKLIGFWTKYTQHFPSRFGSAFIPFDTTRRFDEPAGQYKGELQGVINSQLFFTALAGHHGYEADYFAMPDQGVASSMDQATRMERGPHLGQDRRTRQSTQFTGSLTYVPKASLLGRHEIKVGTTWMFQYTGTNVPEGNHGNYRLIFNNGVPAQIQLFNYPLDSNMQNLNEGGAFVQDTWRLGGRLTVNVGLRYDSFSTWVPEQTKPAGTFGAPWNLSGATPTGAAQSFARVDSGSWRNVAPRIGVVWNIFGNGRTVLKGSWGRYNLTPGDEHGSAYNPNVATISTYRWSGPCVAGPVTCDYIPGTVNLDPNGPDFLSVQGGSNGGAARLPNTEFNPDLKQNFNRSYQVMLERELGPDLGIRGGVSRASNINLWQQIPLQIPYSAWDQRRVVYDAGPTVNPSLTNTTGTPFTIYDVNPAYRGAAFSRTIIVNRPDDRTDTFTSYEVTLTKRATGRWSAIASYVATRNHRWIDGISTNPNMDNFPLDKSLSWQVRLAGSYDLPWAFDISAQYQLQEALLGQRTNNYNLPNSGSLALRVEEFGASSAESMRGNLNLRLARSFRRGSHNLRLSAEVLNATNDSSAYAYTFTAGPAFGRITTISTPRIARLGVTYAF